VTDVADVAEVAARFGVALRRAGVPAGPDRCERFARAVLVARPQSLRELRQCALATLVSSRDHAEALRRVFDATFGGANSTYMDKSDGGPDGTGPAAMATGGFPPTGGRKSANDHEESAAGAVARGSDMLARGSDTLARAARTAREHLAAADGREAKGGTAADGREAKGGTAADGRRVREGTAAGAAGAAGAVGEAGKATDGRGLGGRVLASVAERLAGTDFAELTPEELALLAGVMRRLTLAVPMRRSRRQRRGPRGRQADLRETLRHARRTGGHPFGLIKKNPTRQARKLVVLCDVSGSMEPYARAMLQLLYCAAGGARAEVFCFATRLTRLTRALAQAQPGRALQEAGQAAPDWLGGTRIGASLKAFNDGFGQRGLARGAVVVVVSDGWDTGDPAEVRREMQRLSRLAFRIVWVNPRSHRPGYQPLAGGMAAAWPYCDAVVSAHRLDALDELTAALADPVRRRHPSPAPAGAA
jgi:hypothetical protein